MFASSLMRMPVWRRSSTIAEVRISSLHTSRRFLYSVEERMRGAEVSYLGWATVTLGSFSSRPWLRRNLKKDLVEFSFREADLAV